MCQVGASLDILFEQVTEIVYCGRNALHKVGLALKVSAESVCAQNLERAEQNYVVKACTELLGANLAERNKSLQIYIYKVLLE